MADLFFKRYLGFCKKKRSNARKLNLCFRDRAFFE